ncbi:MAG: holo-ACP synthase [Anaerolineales bacterium]|nr:holo-ACP synthase [Anaerolineales bacterium]MCX7609683.1 holo-ACP synthase [Anaerolineales bacterium]MDW8226886.1 holo-ACP synthase [Anaerolineales bacterium]
MVLKTGIDLIEIDRVQAAIERHGTRFLERVFTPQEITECRGRPEAFAALFAAKEAAVKALGTGIGPVSWCEVETLHHPSGEPYLRLHGRAKAIAGRLGLEYWSVSLTHSRGLAAAVVVAIGSE